MARSRKTAAERHIDKAQVACSITLACGSTTDIPQDKFTAIEEAGLLAVVLNYLESLEDILNCSAVSKRWNMTSEHVRPASLTIPGCGSSLDEDGLMSSMRWVQRKQASGDLQGVTKFSTQIQMGVTDATLQSPTLPVFVHAMISASGSWPIQVCHLDGPFQLRIAVGLLPKTLRQLVLKPEPTTLQEHHPLDIFTRFPHLEHLQIDLGIPAGTIDPFEPKHIVLTEDGCMPKLKSLYISPQPLMFAMRSNMTHFFPCLHYLVASIDYRFSQNVLHMPNLKFLSLTLSVQAALISDKIQHHYLSIPAWTKLQKAHFSGPPHELLRLYLHVHKAGLDIRCMNIHCVELLSDKQLSSECPFSTEWKPGFCAGVNQVAYYVQP